MDAIDRELVERLRSDYAEGMRQLFAANEDLPQRLRAAKVEAVYDMEDNLLEITLDGPQEALSESIENTLYLRVNAETSKIVGIELEHFSQHLNERSGFLRFVLHVLELAGIESIAIVPPVAEPDVDPVRDMRELASV